MTKRQVRSNIIDSVSLLPRELKRWIRRAETYADSVDPLIGVNQSP